MYYATKIRKKATCYYLQNYLEIDSIYLESTNNVANNGWFKKEAIYDYLIDNSRTIKVKNANGPYIIPVKEGNERYVKSEPDNTTFNNLLNLPLE